MYLESIISSGICPPQTPWHYNNLNAHSFGYCALGYFENASLRGYLTLTTLILILFFLEVRSGLFSGPHFLIMYNLIVPIDFFYMEMTNSLFVSGVWRLPNACQLLEKGRQILLSQYCHFLIALKIMSSLWSVWESFGQFKKLFSINTKFAHHLFLLEKIVI